jgi:hypothetical protein
MELRALLPVDTLLEVVEVLPKMHLVVLAAAGLEMELQELQILVVGEEQDFKLLQDPVVLESLL